MSEHEDDDKYGIICPFWIDTDAYTDRDRDMFVAGVEFQMVLEAIRNHDGPTARPIHKENESRIRMACGRFGRVCAIAPCPEASDPQGIWSFLEIQERTEP
jgi:hypothetical protein